MTCTPQVQTTTVKDVESVNLFEFEIVTVNAQGQRIKPSLQGHAEFFTESLGNGVVLEMVAIPGGTFLMGSPEDEPERVSSESPQHNVTIQPFFMGKFPVTQSQWQAVAALDKVNIDLNPDLSTFKGANRPVEYVFWDDAVEFCARLSNKTGKIYRLPTEAEWEYACRAGTTTPFYFGETITTDLANYRGTDWNYHRTFYPGNYAQGPKGEFPEQTTDVGKFPANSFGLFDMHGNVCEWCQDEWHENYNGAPTNGSAWFVGGDDKYRLLRGGSWSSVPRNCRSADRLYLARVDSYDFVGLRVVVVRRRT
ncbi:formylglycine-generating enzyme family protein [Calothrix sp. NIES-2098]|uniref:formylglycine-generating enzyme family protein n=1 Tax=Calothrix sp. NIES-2098 TaxID=1954171 RepID=UPI00403FEB03